MSKFLLLCLLLLAPVVAGGQESPLIIDPTASWSLVSAFTNRGGHTNTCALPAASERCFYRLKQQ